MNKIVKSLILITCLGCAGVGIQQVFFKSNQVQMNYKTYQLIRQDLVSTISSNGTLEPSDAIDIGAQVSALITSFGKDVDGKTIDFGSQVKENSILATLDNEVYQAEYTRATANELQAIAQKHQAEAEEKQAQSNIELAEVVLDSAKASLVEREQNAGKAKNEWERTQKLGKDYASEQTYDQNYWDYRIADAAVNSAKVAVRQAEVSLEQAKIQLTISKTKVVQAQATVEQAKAQIVTARRNLEYCVIKAPVDGVIIDRRVNVGQTVSAGLSAPSLFLLAKDLTKMQVWVSVNEADIGQIKKGMKATFTVDAFPNKIFEGEVSKIRLNASMTSNVVLYIVEVDTDNSSGILLPYLTADVSFEVERHNQVFAVPNAALRYTPSQTKDDLDTEKNYIWVKDSKGTFSAISIKIGMTDGIKTEIVSSELKEGMEIILSETAMTEKEAEASNSVNPFMPSPHRRQNKKSTSSSPKS